MRAADKKPWKLRLICPRGDQYGLRTVAEFATYEEAAAARRALSDAEQLVHIIHHQRAGAAAPKVRRRYNWSAGRVTEDPAIARKPPQQLQRKSA